MTIPANSRIETRNTTAVIPSPRTLPIQQHRITSPKTSLYAEDKPRLTGLVFNPYAHKLVTPSFTPEKLRRLHFHY